MITLMQIKLKAKKIWETQRLQQSYLSGANFIPWSISLPTFSAKTLQQDFSILREWIQDLKVHSKECIGYGYQIIFKEINHRQLGRQSLPSQILFDNQDDFLRFIDKKKEYQQFCLCVDEITAKEPTLVTWILEHTKCILDFQGKWQKLLCVCDFLRNNPLPNQYLRELDIPGVDTKFIEQNKKMLSALFEQLLPADAINQEITHRGAYFFEERYGFKYDEQLIRFRMLDNPSHFHDVSIPLSEFKKLSLSCHQVFITENKVNGLSFPLIKQAIVIFGLGYGIQSLRDISWLKEKEIIYWGDIDTHGFAMLAQLRSYYPQTTSLLMDEVTLKEFKHLWGQEHPDKRCMATLNHLFPEEMMLYQNLQNNIWGENIRLEQERINFNYFWEHLKMVSVACL